MAEIVMKALAQPSIPHIFCDTTLELPTTYEYSQRYKQNRPLTIFRTARNNEQDFYKMCDVIGPPSRSMRWCCTTFKTGPISRVVDQMFSGGSILTFLGIRKAESAMRSKYNRINKSDTSTKIQGQTTASPIFYWSDIDVWLYMLSENVDFNDAYRYGYDRVGCYCCPNNSDRNQFLTKIFMPEQSKRWYNQVLSFAKTVDKPNPIEYVEKGYWKARMGGMGVAASSNLRVEQQTCITEENSKIFKLMKSPSDSFWTMFLPLGILSKELGRKLLDETVVLDYKTKNPLFSIAPFHNGDYEYAIKVKTYPNTNQRDILRKCAYQVRKYNACQNCLKCEAVCQQGAISIKNNIYSIDEDKCTKCGKCISAKYLGGSCLMYRFLFDSTSIK